MLQNNHVWDIFLETSTFQIPEGQELPTISGDSIRRIVKSFLEPIKEYQSFSKSILREIEFADSIGFSDLILDPDGPKPEVLIRNRARIPRFSNIADNINFETKKIIVEPRFRGSISLRNGGIYPAIFTKQIMQYVLSQIQVGTGRNHGYGQVESCQFSRNFIQEENFISSPIYRSFRIANISLIEELSKNPDLIYDVEWRDLERILAQIFEEIGFNVELTHSSHDGGKDLIVSCLSYIGSERLPLKYYIEIKHWKTKVGIGPVHKLIEVTEKDAVNGSVFVSTSGFAPSVTNNAEIQKKVKLNDLSDIYSYFRFYQQSRMDKLYLVKTLEEILSPNMI